MKVAIVYDRVNKWGGAERVLLALHELFPNAPLYTAVYDPIKAPWAKVFPEVIPSFLQNIPFAQNNHELLGFLTPFAFESFNFDEFGLVISVTSEAAKGIITKPGTMHICYCLTPTRYLWSHYDAYFKGLSFKVLTKPIVRYLRNWDKIAAQRPDKMIAISLEVKDRIIKYYVRESEIIFPPVDTEIFTKQLSEKSTTPLRSGVVKEGKYFLVVSRLVYYKRIDLAISVFNKLELPLLVIGAGNEEYKLKRMANDNISFIKGIKDEELATYYQNAKALIFPGEEDFGIVMVEALASGTPVIAYNKGGALDIVDEGKTGILFSEQNTESLISAIEKFEKMKFNKKELVKSAERFSKEIFIEKLREFVVKL